MKKTKNAITFFMAIALCSVVFIGCGAKKEATTTQQQEAQKQQIVMKIAHSQPEGHPRTISVEAFKKIVEEKTGGGIKVEIYPAGQLGSEKETLEQTCSGVIQGFRGGQMDFLPRLYVFTLPFLVETPQQITKLMTSDFAQEICKGSQKDGVIILGLGDAGGLRQISNNVRPIQKPSDLAGLKMRTPGIDTIDGTLRAMGANTMQVPYNDLYMALKTGVADGQENPLSNVISMKFYEVQKYFTIINYQFHPDPFYVNLQWWNTLPQEYQQIIKDATVEMFKVNNQAIADKEGASLATIKEHCSVYELNEAQRQEFKKAAQPVYDQYIKEGKITQQELDTMRAIVAQN